MNLVPFSNWAAGAALKTRVAQGLGRLLLPTVHRATVKTSVALPAGPWSELHSGRAGGISELAGTGWAQWVSIDSEIVVAGRGRVLINPLFIIWV